MAMASRTSIGLGAASTTMPSTTTYWYGGSSRWTTSITALARSMSRPGYGPTVMGSDAVGLTPIGVLVVTLVIVTSTADVPWLTVKF
jgi:hypothetical protein